MTTGTNIKIYTEEELIDPALFVLNEYGGPISTSTLISELNNLLHPEGDDAEILFGRNDTKFSQKVRNLISHKSLIPKYADYLKDSKTAKITINDEGRARLLSSEFYAKNHQNGVAIAGNSDNFDGDDELDTIPIYNHGGSLVIGTEYINYSIYELKRKYDRTIDDKKNGRKPKNGLIVDDSFQRTGNVWSLEQKSKLVESILLQIPIPFVYLSEGKNANLIVIDGRQRLTALFDFLDNKFALKKLELLPELNGKKAKNLINDENNYIARIEDAYLNIIKIKSSTSEELKLQIFSRVNRNGTQLNAQEIRHALHQGFSTQLLNEISDEYDILPKKRMKDRYLALRYIALRLYYEEKLFNYQLNKKIQYDSLNAFLGNAMDAINTFDSSQILNIKEDFEYSYTKSMEIFGGKAFRFEVGKPINMILFEITLLLVSLSRDRDVDIEDALQKMINIEIQPREEEPETPFEKNIKYHRDSKENVTQRLIWIKKILGE